MVFVDSRKRNNTASKMHERENFFYTTRQFSYYHRVELKYYIVNINFFFYIVFFSAAVRYFPNLEFILIF